MTRVLLAAHPTVGHVSGLRAIGARLLEHGHEVAMVMTRIRLPFVHRMPQVLRAAAAVPGLVEGDGITVLPLGTVLAQLWHGARIPLATGQDEVAIALRFFTAGLRGQAKEIAGHASSWRADVVLGDYLMPSAHLGAKLAGLPYGAFYHSALPFPAEGAPPFGSALLGVDPADRRWRDAQRRYETLGAEFDSRVRGAAAELGVHLPPRSVMRSPLSSELNLLATLPELEPGLAPLPEPVCMVGPCLPQVDTRHDDPALRLARGQRVSAYVSLGTVFSGKPSIYHAILDGLALLRRDHPSLQALVSAGGSFASLSERRGPDVHVFSWVPQVALLREVQIVISHGGNNTVQETIAAGVPLVVIPFGGDQVVNAARIERLGIGVCVLPGALTPETLRAAVASALDPDVVRRAAQLGEVVQARDGVQSAVEEILKLAV